MLGTVTFEADGQAYRLVFGVNGLCALEELLGQDVQAIGEQLGASMKMQTLRALFWAGLQEHHDALDLKAAGRLMTEIGPQAAGELIGRAFKAAFPGSEAGEASAGPQTAAAGTGKSSSSAG